MAREKMNIEEALLLVDKLINSNFIIEHGEDEMSHYDVCWHTFKTSEIRVTYVDHPGIALIEVESGNNIIQLDIDDKEERGGELYQKIKPLITAYNRGLNQSKE